jgi:hypothetical protein
MKQAERDLMVELMLLSETDIHEAENPYSPYDCESDKAIIELKVRGKVYDEKLIEFDKICRNTIIAEEKGKDFVYVVKDPGGIYYKNISKDRDTLSKPPVKISCPKTTEFSNNEYVDKLCYTINMTKII